MAGGGRGTATWRAARRTRRRNLAEAQRAAVGSLRASAPRAPAVEGKTVVLAARGGGAKVTVTPSQQAKLGLGREIGRGTAAVVFERIGHPDQVVKLTIDPSAAVYAKQHGSHDRLAATHGVWRVEGAHNRGGKQVYAIASEKLRPATEGLVGRQKIVRAEGLRHFGQVAMEDFHAGQFGVTADGKRWKFYELGDRTKYWHTYEAEAAKLPLLRK